MGCVESTRAISPSEVPLVAYEKSLGFDKWLASQVATIIKKYSYHDLININQLEAISEALSLSFSLPDDPSSPAIEALYVDNSISTRKFLMLGIVCAQGTAAEKAEEVFNAYDIDLVGQLSRLALDVLLDDLFYTVLTVLNSSADSSYISKCSATVPHVKKYLSDCICQGRDFCLKAQFVNSWEKFRGGRLLSPSAMRQYLLSCSTPRINPFEYIQKPLYMNLAA
mmetsp:Transcript_19307/g.35570  ORF Transcript_19307/g.35570 Transcript_19307/m.35570 type:complete len:225 (+) Transcript_19307:2992-3666(+)